MVNNWANFEETAAEIDEAPVDPEVVGQFKTEYDFLKLGTDLLREGGQWTGILANTFVGNSMTWDVRQAVIGCHVVRLFKLIRELLQLTVSQRAELAWVVVRLIAECTINLRYLLMEPSQELIRSFLFQSLQLEHELRHTIKTNIEARGGTALPIEKRMLESIDQTFANSKVTIDELPRQRIRNWGGKNIYERAADLGLGEAYLSIMRGPSRNIHGNWHDFLQHHLEVVRPGEFRPRFDEIYPRPQLIYALLVLIVPALIAYSEFLGTDDAARVKRSLDDLLDRARTADELHEAFLSEGNDDAV